MKKIILVLSFSLTLLSADPCTIVNYNKWTTCAQIKLSLGNALLNNEKTWEALKNKIVDREWKLSGGADGYNQITGKMIEEAFAIQNLREQMDITNRNIFEIQKQINEIEVIKNQIKDLRLEVNALKTEAIILKR